ncbi:MAG: gluconate 2-dehydrogenase subunit 3 family protein [Acidobacteria bacterium]|nr:gluconate 2-dehydrogenase subunit 3 family protein [Acidobacteriota bacterium]
MEDPKGRDHELSRRAFLTTTGKAVITGLAGAAVGEAVRGAEVTRRDIVAALGDTLVPSAPGDPGYRDLESYGITDEVLQGLSGLSDEMLQGFNAAAEAVFPGRTFVALAGGERARYLKAVIEGAVFKSNPQQAQQLQQVYTMVRTRVFTVYYSNFPENKIPADASGVPVPTSKDPHQIFNPNTSRLVTGWDVAGYKGPVRWEEEEALRARMKKIHWHE